MHSSHRNESDATSTSILQKTNRCSNASELVPSAGLRFFVIWKGSWTWKCTIIDGTKEKRVIAEQKSHKSLGHHGFFGISLLSYAHSSVAQFRYKDITTARLLVFQAHFIHARSFGIFAVPATRCCSEKDALTSEDWRQFRELSKRSKFLIMRIGFVIKRWRFCHACRIFVLVRSTCDKLKKEINMPHWEFLEKT